MKKLVIGLLILAITFCMFGCMAAVDVQEKYLPYGLLFGQHYDTVHNVIRENGYGDLTLRAASSNSGFLTSPLSVRGGSFDWEFLHSETLMNYTKTGDSFQRVPYALADPAISFSFNQDKELYEMYCLFDNTTSFSDEVSQEIIDYYDKMFGMEGCPAGFGIVSRAKWENEMMAVEMFVEGDVFAIILHNFEYDLDH